MHRLARVAGEARARELDRAQPVRALHAGAQHLELLRAETRVGLQLARSVPRRRAERQGVALGFGAKQPVAVAAAARAADLEEEFDDEDDDEDNEMLEEDESSDEELSAHAGRSVSFR